MTTLLLPFLFPDAQEELIRNNLVDLMIVQVNAVPDPYHPDDPGSMAVVGSVSHDFRNGVPEIDGELARITDISRLAADDLTEPVWHLLSADLNRRRDELNIMHQEMMNGTFFSPDGNSPLPELIRPENIDGNPDVLVWCNAWSIAMDDDGKIVSEPYPPLLSDKLDEISRNRIADRIRNLDILFVNLLAMLGVGGTG